MDSREWALSARTYTGTSFTATSRYSALGTPKPVAHVTENRTPVGGGRWERRNDTTQAAPAVELTPDWQ